MLAELSMLIFASITWLFLKKYSNLSAVHAHGSDHFSLIPNKFFSLINSSGVNDVAHQPFHLLLYNELSTHVCSSSSSYFAQTK